MRKVTVRLLTSAAILCVSAVGWQASALSGPGPAKTMPAANFTPRHEAACRGFGPYCGPGFTRVCGPYRCWCRPCY